MTGNTVAKSVQTTALESQSESIFRRFEGNVAARMWGFVRPHQRLLIVALLCIGIFTLIQVSIPLSLRHVVDTAVGDGSAPLTTAVLAFVALVAGYAVFQFLSEWLATKVAQTVIFDLRRAMFVHVHEVSLTVLDRTQVGRLMARLQGDIGALQEFLENSMSALGDLFLLLGIVVVLMLLDLRLGLLTLSILPVMVIVRAAWIPWAKVKYLRAREASSIVNATLAENINGVRTVQESRREDINFAGYQVKANDNLQSQIESAKASQLMVPVVDLLTGLALAVVVLAGSESLRTGEISIGVIVAYIFLVQRFFDPIRTLSMQYTMMQRASASGQRVFEVLDVPLTLEDKFGAPPLNPDPPTIEFSHVSFGYRKDECVLHDINLCIQANQSVAIVGATGSGKTSLVGLVHRFSDPTSGVIRIAGQDLREVSIESLGKHIGMVIQEPFLFSGSILDNIRYGADWATDEQVVEAARAVHAHDFIVQLPDGYQTQLGQRGINLSVGQRQLLSFARVLVADPRLLILDEATANIDSITELKIQQAMKTLLHNRTSLIIAHRLATVRDADRIIVMDHGRIAESGSHAELLRQGGLYARMHASSLNPVSG
ncbi:MAG: multidrug ABC transporter [Gammaproteobacteria bacterium HGW-Gammaproteobacteria-11]|nr:MAG: multidrug ABC transporter [Gammaproteobacteria bacterium HGW-Gammaproteobacteria-11]